MRKSPANLVYSNTKSSQPSVTSRNKSITKARRLRIMLSVRVVMIAVVVFASLVAVSLLYVYRKLTFWSRQNVANELTSIFNRFQQPFHIADDFSAKKYGDVVGIYEGLTPCLMIKDLELVKKVLIEEFWNFPNHRKFYAEGQLASQSIVVLEDQKWKRMRQILSPVFSPAKIKYMRSMCRQSIQTLIENLNDATKDQIADGAVIDLRQYYGAFSVDMICSLVFGIKINSLKDPENEVVRMIRKFFGNSLSWRQLLILSFPVLMRIFDVYLLNYDVLKYLNDLTMKIMEEKKNESSVKAKSQKDFINLLMEANGADGQRLCDQEIADQIILFFVAGYDTSAATLTAISYCLAMNQTVQETLFHEVRQVMQSTHIADDEDTDEVGAEPVSQMRFMDAVIRESMRFLPIVPRMERRCNKDCYLQTDNREIFIPSDAMIIIPIYSLCHDERYFMNPENFDPNRFLDSDQEARLTPAYLPFAAGPRSCIGQRFAMMELKECMVQVLNAFQFDVCPQTKLEYYLGNPVSTTKQVFLRVKRRT